MQSNRTYGRALVLGLGRSGAAASALLLDERSAVTAVDAADAAALRERAAPLRARGAEVRLGARDLPPLTAAGRPAFDVCVVSPGVPLDSAWLNAVRSAGIAILPELELGMRRTRCRVLAVTGTNGKSTMVKLCREALEAAGLRAEAAGNYGTPLCETAPRSGGLDWVVAEVSTFQMETAQSFAPHAAVLLNIRPDHLDRHASLAAYAALKLRMFADMPAGRPAVAPVALREEARARNPGLRWLTFGAEADADFRYAPQAVHFREAGRARALSLAATCFANDILGLTAAAAVAAMAACGADRAAVARAASVFEPLPHRLAEVCRARDVRFVDDSKGTNLAALEAALAAVPGRIRLIAGGLLKETDLDGVKTALAARVRQVYLIGAAAEKLETAWNDTVPCRRCGDLPTAVRAAWADAEEGDAIVLSPGCASFDQFTGYGQRGEMFAALAREVCAGAGDKREERLRDDSQNGPEKRPEEP